MRLLLILLTCCLVGCTTSDNIRACGATCLKQGGTMDYYDGGSNGKCQCK